MERSGSIVLSGSSSLEKEAQVQFSENALQIDEDLPLESWLEIGRRLSLMERGHQWWIGDWANYGERKYGDLKAAVEDTPFNYQTVRNCMWVARRFELSLRKDSLRFNHYAIVAALPDEAAFRLLAVAEADHLSVADLRILAQREQNLTGELPSSDTCSVKDLEILIARGAKFATIYADPPWLYGNQATRASTDRHYGGMTVEEIIAYERYVRPLSTDDAHLHLWTTNAFLFRAPEIIKAWGFEYKSCFVWVKPQMGIGNYWRVSHEFLLFATRGSVAFRNRAAKSWLEAKRGKHSSKPEAVRRLIETASPSPRFELFGRHNATGWTVFGNEILRSELLDGDVEEL